MKKTYRVPVEFRSRGYQTVDADSYEEAVAFMLKNEQNLSIPTTSTPIEGSMRVRGEGKCGKNAKKIVEIHEKLGFDTLPKDTSLNRTMYSDTITKL